MTVITVLDFVNLFFAGMLAGIEFVIHYGLREPAEMLDDHAQLQLRKALVLKLRVLVPAFFVPAALLGITLTFLNTASPGFVFRCAAVVALLIWIGIRVIGTVPINSATVGWQLSAPVLATRQICAQEGQLPSAVTPTKPPSSVLLFGITQRSTVKMNTQPFAQYSCVGEAPEFGRVCSVPCDVCDPHIPPGYH